MLFSTSLIIAIAALVLAVLALVVVIITSRKQTQVIERQQQRLMMLTETVSDVLALKKQLELQQAGDSDAQTAQLHEQLQQQLDAQSQRLQQTVDALNQEHQALARKLQQLAEQDPAAKLYQRAAKLIASGASVEEIMQECDLPRAEAELMMSMHPPIGKADGYS